MFKGLAVSAVFVFLLSSATGAALLNDQAFLILEGNTAFAPLGDGGAGSTNTAVVDQSQMANSVVDHVTVFQGETAALTQGAGAVGSVAPFGVTQQGFGYGEQYQFHPGGGTNPVMQSQLLNADLTQNLIDGGGLGSAVGIQSLVGIQTQLAFTLWGATANIQGVGVTVFDGMAGGPGGGTMIGGGTTIGVNQTQ